MPCVVRKFVDGRLQNHSEFLPDEWRLREQVEALEAWLADHGRRLDPSCRWIADIGFCVRDNAAGGGPLISHNLMRLCLDANLEIHLSEYPGTA